ncbi:MAG TPA: peptidylprolyl isomerase [Terriglobales bacterium]|nr:peptidylprolyl isomerase [Terriglobales bacterium]
MQKAFALVGILCVTSLLSWSQAAPAAKPAAKPIAKPATSAAAAPRPSGPTAVIDTTVGKLKCELFPDKAPIGVANFIGLANGTKDWVNPVSHAKKHGVPLYDGTIFHRVIPEFMIQGGDPAGTGMGDPGYSFKNETSPILKFDRPGRLAYANAGPDTNGSQFFVTEVPYASLNGGYTIFGQCDDASVALVKQIARMGKDGNDRPFRPVKINHISVTQSIAAKRTTLPKATPGVRSGTSKPIPPPSH